MVIRSPCEDRISVPRLHQKPARLGGERHREVVVCYGNCMCELIDGRVLPGPCSSFTSVSSLFRPTSDDINQMDVITGGPAGILPSRSKLAIAISLCPLARVAEPLPIWAI